MHRVLIHLSVIALLLASASLAFAQATTKSYSGTYNGAACTVQMTWRNWAGLGAVDGRIKLARGATIPFSGSNTQTGVLDLTANGTAIRLVRRGGGRNTSWSSPTLSLIESATTPTPGPSPSPTPTPPPISGEDGTQVSIEGWQPSADSMEFSLAPDPGGATYKTTKSTGEGKARWESSSLTLIEKK